MKIVKFYQSFRAVDYNDSSTVSGWAFPSDKYIDLTLGATDASYLAPANGWFSITKTAQGTGHMYLNMYNWDTKNNTRKLGTSCNTNHTVSGDSTLLANYIPAKKGDTIKIAYNLTGETMFFRFVYAEGEV